MSSPIYDPEPERPRWRKRRRKWYIKLADRLRECLASFGWKTWLGAGLVALAAALLSAFYPRIVPTSHVLRGEPIMCLIPGQSGFDEICTIESAASPDGKVLTVRSPDGEFRRLLVVRDGRGVIAADGAEEVGVKSAGVGSIDVRAGEIVWRLPATVQD